MQLRGAVVAAAKWIASREPESVLQKWSNHFLVTNRSPLGAALRPPPLHARSGSAFNAQKSVGQMVWLLHCSGPLHFSLSLHARTKSLLCLFNCIARSLDWPQQMGETNQPTDGLGWAGPTIRSSYRWPDAAGLVGLRSQINPPAGIEIFPSVRVRFCAMTVRSLDCGGPAVELSLPARRQREKRSLDRPTDRTSIASSLFP